MRSPCLSRAFCRVLLVLMAGACGRDANQSRAAVDAPPAGAAAETATFGATELDAYERGLAKEIELVQAAQERQRTATTAEARGEAMQAQWEEQTIPEGARSAGLTPERYRQVREGVNRVLQTLDFQGKIDGPMEMDTTRATPEMRQRLSADPFAELTPAFAAALKARLDRLVPLWVQYVRLTAVAG